MSKNEHPKSIRNMRIYDQYFQLIKAGTKTIEVRVAYPGMRKIAVGTVIRFCTDSDFCDRRVVRIASYSSFSGMMAQENSAKINPTKSADEQLREIKKIFPPSKEKIGVIIFEFVPA